MAEPSSARNGQTLGSPSALHRAGADRCGHPSVSPTYAGQRVEIAFTVDGNGTVSGFSVKSSPDAALAESVMDAVRRWKFQPAVSGGVAVATKVVLPVTITEDRVVGAPFAAR